MATIQLQIPDAILPRVLDAIALQYGYDPVGGQTKAQFAKAVILRFVKDTVKNQEAAAALITARDAAAAAAESQIILS